MNSNKCKTCGLDIPNNRKYCSLKCSNNSPRSPRPHLRSKSRVYQCTRCGTGFDGRNKRANKFCSIKCHGANNSDLSQKRLGTKYALKKHLIKENGRKCSWCGLSEWRGLPMPIEIDHIDGNRRNNVRENVRLLCHNCHAQTPTFRNRKREQFSQSELVRS